MSMDRRSFLQLLSAGAAAATFPASISRALEIPANNRTGTLADVEHVVFMMQENRSFDHYFGTLRGVRGFGDPRAVKLPNGKSIFYQPDGDNYVLPFHPPAPDMGLQFLEDLAHDWTTTHEAWNQGTNDQWVPAKGPVTMAHLTRSDIPFHYALADAFTVCDAYHCSLLGPTDPNRYHMWTGWVGNDSQKGGPVIDNAEAGYDWSTYPERLEKAGVSWKIYQDTGEGLDAEHYWGWTGDNAYIGNYGDNSLLYFHQYQDAKQNSSLAKKARTGTEIATKGTLFDDFRNDIKAGRLPQVSWVVAPEAYTEHPNWPANYGAWYVSQVLDALTDNPEVWSKTAFFLMYDENDGFFDHMVPPTPPQSRAQGLSTVSITNEIFEGNAENAAGPYGLGMRVPMIVISPWSKGGWVNSEVFDHTSLIQFIEKRFGQGRPELSESNITEWRRAVTGDLTSAFNFAHPNGTTVPLPSTVAYQPPDSIRHPDYSPAPPVEQALPQQERGTRPARAVPYAPHVYAKVDSAAGTVRLHFSNTGKSAAVFHVRSRDGQGGPWTYTVSPGARVVDTWTPADHGRTGYYLSVYGPNGFLRTYKGDVRASGKANLEISCHHNEGQGNTGTFTIRNHAAEAAKVSVLDSYTKERWSTTVNPGALLERFVTAEKSFGWYVFSVTVESDASFSQKLAGHFETGKDSVTDPAIGAV